MSRRLLFGSVALATALLAMSGFSVAAAGNTKTPAVTVLAPSHVVRGVTTAVTLRLPANVAAVEGRVFVDRSAVEVIGIAPLGGGKAMRPVDAGGASSFGAYGLHAVNGHTTLSIVVYPRKSGHLQVRVTVDAAADKYGHRLPLNANRLSTVGVGTTSGTFTAPDATPGPVPTRAAGPTRELIRDGRFNSQDLDTVRGDWYQARNTGAICSSSVDGDANGDGCVDVVDLQAELAAKGHRTTAPAPAVVGGKTFTVTSTADTVDANPGDGTCADSLARCTLRAAMMEADWLPGNDRIEFALVGVAPVTIQLSSQLPMITSLGGTVTIDGYTQTGAGVNTATVGSNAIMGVEVRGNGAGPKETAFRITSPGNTIRGLLIDDIYMGIFFDGSNATGNKVIGNWIGFERTGLNASSEHFAVIFNTGANHNFNGTPALADRNVIGNYEHAEENYGPGTDYNTTQNNVMCEGPTGLTTANCWTGIDHNFGPKFHQIGGTGTNEKNVIGGTLLQGIEFSHGWDPSNHAYSAAYEITGNRAVGNWVGFQGDGSYNASFRSGLNFSSSDNGNGINDYDGSNANTIESNYIASVYDGIQVESPNAHNVLVRNNIIGTSPLGQAAPLTGWGVVVRWAASHDTFQGNTISNATKGGFGLLVTNNNGSTTSYAYNIRITQNIITNTNGPAIDLFGVAGPDPNDPGDADMGADTLLNTPVFTSVTTTAAKGTAGIGSTVELYRASRPAGQFGLPTAYLGSAIVANDHTWTIPVTLAVGDLVTALQIQTDDNTSELAANFAAAPAPVNRQPVFTTNFQDRSDAEGTSPSLDADATDPDGDVLTYSATGLPPGMAINSSNGVITGTLPFNGAGTYPVTLTVSDGSLTDTDTFNWTVTDTDRAPTAGVVLSPTKPGSNATLTATATKSDPDGDPVSLTFVWSVNGTAQRTFTSSSALTDTFDLSLAGHGDAGDTVRVDVTPSDGTLTGSASSDQVTVATNTVYASDLFGRAVANGWGSADLGGAYTLQGSSANYNVSGGAGSISMGAGLLRSAILTGVSQSDVDVSFRVAVDKVPAGGSQFIYGVVRRVSATTEYRAKIRIANTGNVYVQASSVVGNVETAIGSEVQVTGLTATPGSFIWLRTQVVGTSPTTLRIRAWADGTSEPSTWQYTATNSAAQLQAPGAVGVRAYTGGPVSNAPIVLTFDNFQATSIN